jgi:hypothetical protein
LGLAILELWTALVMVLNSLELYLLQVHTHEGYLDTICFLGLWDEICAQRCSFPPAAAWHL